MVYRGRHIQGGMDLLPYPGRHITRVSLPPRLPLGHKTGLKTSHSSLPGYKTGFLPLPGVKQA